MVTVSRMNPSEEQLRVTEAERPWTCAEGGGGILELQEEEKRKISEEVHGDRGHGGRWSAAVQLVSQKQCLKELFSCSHSHTTLCSFALLHHAEASCVCLLTPAASSFSFSITAGRIKGS